jgi:hypothetical protein
MDFIHYKSSPQAGDFHRATTIDCFPIDTQLRASSFYDFVHGNIILYSGQMLVCCTSPGCYIVMTVEQLVE